MSRNAVSFLVAHLALTRGPRLRNNASRAKASSQKCQTGAPGEGAQQKGNAKHVGLAEHAALIYRHVASVFGWHSEVVRAHLPIVML